LGIVWACAALSSFSSTASPIFQNKLAWVLAHAGRITTYSILGLSSAPLVKPSGLSTNLQAALSILFAIIAFYMASAFIGLTPSPESLFPGLVQRWGSAIRGFKSASLPTSYLLGLLWGLLPCGLVLTALSQRSLPPIGVSRHVEHAVFGIATLPSLFAVKWLASKSTPALLVTKPCFHRHDVLRLPIRHARICLPRLVDHLMLGSSHALVNIKLVNMNLASASH
jgi:sulfite exporter TauE/SafE